MVDTESVCRVNEAIAELEAHMQASLWMRKEEGRSRAAYLSLEASESRAKLSGLSIART